MKRLAILGFLLSVSLSATLKMDVNEEKILPKTGTTGFIIIENQDVLQLTTRKNAIKVKALRPGQATFVVLVGSERVPYRITVGVIKLPEREIVERPDYSGKVFATNLSMGYGGGKSQSNISNNIWDYSYTTYRLRTTGETPIGFLVNQIDIKNRGDSQGVNALFTSITTSIGLFAVGDQFLPQQASILFPAQPVQGFRYEGGFNNISYFLFTGKNNYGLWGAALEREERAAQDLSLVKATMRVNPSSSVGLSLGNGGMSLLGNTLLMGVHLDGEIARDDQGKVAQEASGVYRSGADLSWAAGYRDYQAGFNIPVGLVNYGGYQGLWANFNYQPSDIISLTYSGQRYKRSLAYQMKDENGNQLQLSLLGQRYKDFLPDLTVQIWDNQGASAVNTYDVYPISTDSMVLTTSMTNEMSYLQNGASYMLSKRLPWYGLDVWAKWVPQQVIDQQSPTDSYDKQSVGIGVRLPLFNELLTYQGEFFREETRYHNQSTTPEKIYRSFISTRPLSFFRSNLLLNTFYQYENRQNESTLESFIKHFYKIELQWRLNSLGLLTLGTYRTIDEAPNVYQMNRVLDEWRVEYSQDFNWHVNFGKSKSVVTGVVYVDENNNGMFDNFEKVVPNVRVTLSGSRVMTTNTEGVYRFENVNEGDAIIDLDLSAPQTMMIPDESPKSIKVMPNERYAVNVSVRLNDLIKGFVIDDKEKGFPNVRVLINDQAVKTGENGAYEYSSSEYGGNYSVAIDMSSLPSQYKVLGARNQNVTGGAEINFVLESIKLEPAQSVEYIEIAEIKPIGKTELSITGRILKPILSATINDQKVSLSEGAFQVSVPKKGHEIKFKFFTPDKKIWIKKVPVK